ncbi:D-hexose-6-phosphate mutarotase [Cellulomonas sp. ATA003]|nr:D-hexose-6-phosphate mutarotase [Cellulomonas sp. ATA003]WNB84386.1 D-hexose-6-phosphate mutarotase [Cellulomonas sp. ATA003]
MSDAPVLPSSVRLEDGSGGLPRVVVQGPAATAEVYLQGGHVTAWRPSGHDDVLWTSARSRFAEGTAIRGGVPVCFPWFGPLEGHPDAPAHGFARTLPWTLDAVEESGDDVVVALSLTDSPATHSTPWPHPFRAELRVTVGARLTLALTVHNTGEHPVTFAEALHTYLGVGDVRQVEVGGLEGRRYIDKLGGPEPVDGSAEPARITGETDRIYLDTRGTTTVDDPAAGRRLDVTGEERARPCCGTRGRPRPPPCRTSATTSGPAWSASRRATSARPRSRSRRARATR